MTIDLSKSGSSQSSDKPGTAVGKTAVPGIKGKSRLVGG